MLCGTSTRLLSWRGRRKEKYTIARTGSCLFQYITIVLVKLRLWRALLLRLLMLLIYQVMTATTVLLLILVLRCEFIGQFEFIASSLVIAEETVGLLE